MFSNIEIEENRFYYHKSPIFLENGDVKKVLVSHKTSFLKETINTCWLLV